MKELKKKIREEFAAFGIDIIFPKHFYRTFRMGLFLEVKLFLYDSDGQEISGWGDTIHFAFQDCLFSPNGYIEQIINKNNK